MTIWAYSPSPSNYGTCPPKPGSKIASSSNGIRDHPHEQDLQILKWIDEHQPQAYVDWYPFDHPQLGRVELGGWNVMYTWRNPPPGLMGAEAARNIPFVLAMGDMLPKLTIHTLQVTPLGNHDYRINLIIENTGFCPPTPANKAKNVKPFALCAVN